MSKIMDDIRAVCLSFAGDMGARVKLSQLRRMLPQYSRVDVDRALFAMPDVILISINDPRDISQDDIQSAIDLGRGTMRNALYIERR